MNKQPYILSASISLIGICFVVITGLKITSHNTATYADEISSIDALLFMGSAFFSYLSLRHDRHSDKFEYIADTLFMIGILSLFAAVMIFAHGIW